jgi:hypothetical protein
MSWYEIGLISNFRRISADRQESLFLFLEELVKLQLQEGDPPHVADVVTLVARK